jgi:hypothetical protein
MHGLKAYTSGSQTEHPQSGDPDMKRRVVAGFFCGRGGFVTPAAVWEHFILLQPTSWLETESFSR